MTGDALKLIRILNDKKSKELAEELEISPSYLSQIENNKKKPSFEIMDKYSKVFNMRVSAIIFFSEEYDKITLEGKVKGNTQRFTLKLMETLAKFGGYDE